MKLRTLSVWFSVLILLLLSANMLCVVWVERAYQQLVSAQQHQKKSIDLSNDLQQEIQLLARLVRAYTATDEPRYLLYYYDIIALRQGEKAVPKNYNFTVYWDDVLADHIPHSLPKQGERRVLGDQMRELGFNAQEMQALTQIFAISAQMQYWDQIAFAATQGLYDPEKQVFVSDGKPRLDFASQLVYSKKYRVLKAELAHAVDDLRTMVVQRTDTEVAQISDWLKQLITLLLSSMLLSIVLVLVAFNTVRRRVLLPIHVLKQVAAELQAGVYATRSNLSGASNVWVDELMI